MKKYIYFFIIPLLLISCERESTQVDPEIDYNTPIESRSWDCFDTQVGEHEDCVGPFTYTTTVYVEDYPNCPFNVQTEYYLCIRPGGDWDLYFDDPGIVSPFYFYLQDCDDFVTDWRAAVTAGQSAEEAFFRDFYSEIFEKTSENWILNRLSQIGTTNILCGEASVNVVSYIYTSSCYKVCIDPFGIPPTWAKTSCGDGCCELSYDWCWDDEEEELVSTVTYTKLDQAECYDSEPSYCYGQTNRCLYTCE